MALEAVWRLCSWRSCSGSHPITPCCVVLCCALVCHFLTTYTHTPHPTHPHPRPPNTHTKHRWLPRGAPRHHHPVGDAARLQPPAAATVPQVCDLLLPCSPAGLCLPRAARVRADERRHAAGRCDAAAAHGCDVHEPAEAAPVSDGEGDAGQAAVCCQRWRGLRAELTGGTAV